MSETPQDPLAPDDAPSDIGAQRAQLAEVELRLAAQREALHTERVFTAVRKSLVDWARSFGVLLAIFIAIAGYLGLGFTVERMVEDRVEQLVDPRLEAAVGAAADAAAQRVAEQISDDVRDILERTVVTISGAVRVCHSDQESAEQYGVIQRLHVGLHGTYQKGQEDYDRFLLIDMLSRRGISVIDPARPEEGVFCTYRELDLHRDTKGNPVPLDAAGLPLMSFVRFASLTEFADDDEDAAAALRLAFREFWGQADVRLYLRVNGNGDGFSQSSSVLREDGDLLLGSVRFREEDLGDGRTRLHADFPVLSDVGLGDILLR